MNKESIFLSTLLPSPVKRFENVCNSKPSEGFKELMHERFLRVRGLLSIPENKLRNAVNIKIKTGDKTRIVLSRSSIFNRGDNRPTLVVGPDFDIEQLDRLIPQVGYLTGLMFRFDYATSGQSLVVDPSVVGSDVAVSDLQEVSKMMMDKPKYTSRYVCLTTEPSELCLAAENQGYVSVNLSHADWKTNAFQN